jgi:hypothetical protein
VVEHGPHPDPQILLAEYTALRAEIERRSTTQWNIFALQITAAGAVTGLAISAMSNLALLLIVPMVSYTLGNRYILHDFHLKLIRRYLRESLSGRLNDQLQWDGWRSRELAAEDATRRWFTATGWTVLHPTRLAFEGVAVLALTGALAASIYVLLARSPSGYLITGFAAGWLLGLVSTVFMHRTFKRAGTY